MAFADHTRGNIEQRLRQAITTGALVNLRASQPEADDPAQGATWDQRRAVSATLLAELLTQPDQGMQRPRALRLTGARITGRLDLEGAELVRPVLLSDCWFDDPVTLAEAKAMTIRLPGCHLPVLQAAQLITRGNLELTNGFTAYGEVSLLGAHIGGVLGFNGATLINPDGRALAADGLTVDHSLVCRRGFSAQGEIRLLGARVGGSLEFHGATLTNPNGHVLIADRLTVGQSLVCRTGFSAHGEVRLLGAHIGGTLEFTGATLTNPNGAALNATGATVEQDMYCRAGFTAQGEVNLVGAHIGGQLSFTGATLTNPDRRALAADGLTVDQAMFCDEGFTAHGEVRLMGAHISRQLSFNGAALSNPAGHALAADSLIVDQGMFCRAGFTAQGQVRLIGAHIVGALEFHGATLANPDGLALDLEAAQVGELYLRPLTAPSRVDLTQTKVGLFADDQTTWPNELRLVGFTYDALGERPAVSAKHRLDWLRRDLGGYSPQPYEQLAAVYRRGGREEDARRVAIAKQHERRRALPKRAWPARLWSLLLGALVGYGYRTWLAGLWLVGLVAGGWILFDLAHPAHLIAAKPAGQRPWFHAGAYALDLLLPFANLGYQDNWIVRGWWVLGLYLLWNLAGWVLTTAVVAALTGLLRRD